ncbi:DUF6288 domain-containing protein [Haloferula sp. A504]|uniref:DUF6288 domain-containing protein n=1 Tax=Haloferula sp. A504 TaxID=3373601 RepID=UPI0031C6C340|nr:DUF6288 domain-containing protein [Verrucomicrobiaceae bacterium E54]
MNLVRTALVLPLMVAGSPRAALLPDPVFSREATWHLPGDERAVVLPPGDSAVGEIPVPGLSEKEKAAGGAWRGILSVDLFGTTDGAPGKVAIEALDPATGEVFATTEAAVPGGVAPRAAWAVIASSEQPGAEGAKAFDGDTKTDWHSRYGGDQPKPPHWIGLAFSAPRRIDGVSLLPRQGGFTNGVPRDWRVEARHGGNDWKEVAAGSSDRAEVADRRGPVVVKFAEPIEAEAVRFVIDRDWSGGGFGTAAELTCEGITLEERKPAVAAGARAWLEVPPELMKALQGKAFGLRLTSREGMVVAAEPRAARIHLEPGGKLFGRSNGGLGPDKLGVGLLGFTAMTEHRHTVLSVIEVRPEGPAAKAGLRRGDAIVSVGGVPLTVNDLAPGWTWFHESHEAALGRAIEAALAAGETSLDLGVIRGGKIVNLPVELGRTRPFTTMNPKQDPEAARLVDDMLGWLVKNQQEDGAWSGDIKRTTLAGLALLATEKAEHEELVKRAVEWSLSRFDRPEKHGNLGFWGGAFMGILYAEWHLRTGDERVLPHLEAMRDWAYDGRHMSKWDVPALGHGPDGLPYDQKALVAPACHLLVFEALAMRCGMEDRLWEMLLPYMEMSWSDPADGGHGALGYNRSYKDLGEFWSRTGLFAMACHLRGERPDMRDAMIGIMKERHPWFRNSHAYGEPGGGLGLLGLQLVDPDGFSEMMRDYAWWFSLAWQPGYGLKFTQPHMGAPYMGEDDLFNAMYALVLQAPKKSLHLTGRRP